MKLTYKNQSSLHTIAKGTEKPAHHCRSIFSKISNKRPVINLCEKVKYLYTEDFKTVKKGIKEENKDPRSVLVQ